MVLIWCCYKINNNKGLFLRVKIKYSLEYEESRLERGAVDFDGYDSWIWTFFHLKQDVKQRHYDTKTINKSLKWIRRTWCLWLLILWTGSETRERDERTDLADPRSVTLMLPDRIPARGTRTEEPESIPVTHTPDDHESSCSRGNTHTRKHARTPSCTGNHLLL